MRNFFLLPLLIISLSISSGSVFAQQQSAKPYWYTLERGKLHFRSGEYGEALTAFEEARDQRKAMYTRMEEDLITLLSLPEVRRMGDSLVLIEPYIVERGHIDAAEALAELYYRVPKASLGDSARAAMETIGRFKDFPDAEYWIGEAYREEGEFGIALKQYEKAYEQRALLETPGFDLEILYKIAYIQRLRRDYAAMEERLLEILKRDTLWAADTADRRSESFVRTAMMRTLENEGVSRFLTLYRYNNQDVERAHRLLGLYYHALGRHERGVQHLLFAFLIQNSVLLEEIIKNQFDFSFTTLDELMAATPRRTVLLSYMEEVEYYKTLYYLGTSLYGSGRLPPARELWAFLSSRGGLPGDAAGEWSARGAAQLRSPFLEQAVEMP
jgi:tetratricopeptide (TPR) repeat protein